MKGRSVTVSQKILSEWNIEKTSNIDLRFEFIEELESKREYENSSPTLDDVLSIIKQNDPQYHFKYHFNKMSQVSIFLPFSLPLFFLYSCSTLTQFYYHYFFYLLLPISKKVFSQKEFSDYYVH